MESDAMEPVTEPNGGKPEASYSFRTIVVWRLLVILAITMLIFFYGMFYSFENEAFFNINDKLLTWWIIGTSLVGCAFLGFGGWFFCMKNEEKVTISDAGIRSLRHGEIAFSDMRAYSTQFYKSTALIIWCEHRTVSFKQSIFETSEFKAFVAAFASRVHDYNQSPAGKENPIGSSDPMLQKTWVKVVMLTVIPPILVAGIIFVPGKMMVAGPFLLYALALTFSGKPKAPEKDAEQDLAKPAGKKRRRREKT